MADVKGGLFAKTVQKHAGRAKEKILQNLGKADKTTDEVFEEFESNFARQQSNANRLHKEVSNYLRCCRALHGASKSLFETLGEVYEPEWVGHDLLYAQSQNADMLWSDFCHKLQDQTLAPLTAYQMQFPEIRKRIDKRGRKLVDFDSQRHQLENLQRATRRDEYKIARARDTLENARVTYEGLNKELYQELPELYDQRIPNVASHLQSLFAAESTFMVESSKVAKELEAIADKLSKECAKGTYKGKRVAAPRPLSVAVMDSSSPPPASSSFHHGGKGGGVGSPSIRPTISSPLPLLSPPTGTTTNPTTTTPPTPPPTTPTTTPPTVTPLTTPPTAPTVTPLTTTPPTSSPPVPRAKEETLGRPYEEIEFEDKKQLNGSVSPRATNGELVLGTKIPTGATTEDLPPGVLYRVRATYKYTREDVDEISFEVGDVIQVVEYEDPEEQEEGWLCGMKETTLEKGLFPANFTRPI
ncbi:amphiphysin-like isoform X2 [Penaeus japonicus]|uniref:amphiphysin-like isoform X2 n=1 Tax=Penaeus japonicus TaxID=27405 RepID=UPI001C716158|nr:amphiphysin-like isoform X2 [Penaeus japonicus]